MGILQWTRSNLGEGTTYHDCVLLVSGRAHVGAVGAAFFQPFLISNLVAVSINCSLCLAQQIRSLSGKEVS